MDKDQIARINETAARAWEIDPANRAYWAQTFFTTGWEHAAHDPMIRPNEDFLLHENRRNYMMGYVAQIASRNLEPIDPQDCAHRVLTLGYYDEDNSGRRYLVTDCGECGNTVRAPKGWERMG